MKHYAFHLHLDDRLAKYQPICHLYYYICGKTSQQESAHLTERKTEVIDSGNIVSRQSFF